MSALRRPVVALVIGLAVLAALSLFDNGVLLKIQRQAVASFSQGAYALFAVLGALAIAAGVMLIGWLAWASRSKLVAVAFILVGGLVVLVPVLLFSVPINWPDWAARALTSVILTTGGPLNAATIVGAGMLIAGITAPLGRSRRFARS